MTVRMQLSLVFAALALALAVAGCEIVVDDSGDFVPNSSTDQATDWPTSVLQFGLDETLDDDLSAGSAMSLDWADQSSMACWPATENMNFDGNHVLYALTDPMPDHAEVWVTVTPAPGVDVSVYAYQIGTTNFATPPTVQSAVSCEAGYDAQTDSNPGEAETLMLQSVNNPYNVLIGVVGTDAATVGAYTLTVDVVQ